MGHAPPEKWSNVEGSGSYLAVETRVWHINVCLSDPAMLCKCIDYSMMYMQ